MHNHIFKVAVASAAAAITTFGFAGVASAHVSPVESTAPAGGYTTVELQVPHGCDGAATERFEVQLNDQISSVKAEAIPGWSVSYEREPLAEPIELHGQEVADYVSVIAWTADDAPLPDDQFLRFGISMKVPDTPGESLGLPAVQHCVGGGTSSWIEEDPDGDHPAPAVELIAAQGGHGDGDDTTEADDAASADEGAASNEVAAADGGSGSGTDTLARVLGGAAVALAAVAVALTVRKRTA